MKTVNLVASLPFQGNYEVGDFIGVDRGASYLLTNDIVMKAVIGDFDSIDVNDYNDLKRQSIEIIKLNPIKDETDLEAAINYVLECGYEKVNIYGALGARVDHTLVNINLLKKYPIITLYDDYGKVYYLNKGIHQIVAEYTYYSFFAIKETIISLTNFKYPLTNYLLKLDDTLCISNELEKDAQIEIDEDIIVIVSQ